MKLCILKVIGLMVLSLVFILTVNAPGLANSKAKEAAQKQVGVAKILLKKAASKVSKIRKTKPSPLVVKAQVALNKLGGKLKVNGVVGIDTSRALRSFQKKNKLKQTGMVDKAAMAKLGIK